MVTESLKWVEKRATPKRGGGKSKGFSREGGLASRVRSIQEEGGGKGRAGERKMPRQDGKSELGGDGQHGVERGEKGHTLRHAVEQPREGETD